jgi:hypothetical protein
VGAGSADTDGLCGRLFAIQIAHQVSVVPVTGSSACWNDGLNCIEVGFAQVHPQCIQRLCETVPAWPKCAGRSNSYPAGRYLLPV